MNAHQTFQDMTTCKCFVTKKKEKHRSQQYKLWRTHTSTQNEGKNKQTNKKEYGGKINIKRNMYSLLNTSIWNVRACKKEIVKIYKRAKERTNEWANESTNGAKKIMHGEAKSNQINRKATATTKRNPIGKMTADKSIGNIIFFFYTSLKRIVCMFCARCAYCICVDLHKANVVACEALAVWLYWTMILTMMPGIYVRIHTHNRDVIISSRFFLLLLLLPLTATTGSTTSIAACQFNCTKEEWKYFVSHFCGNTSEWLPKKKRSSKRDIIYLCSMENQVVDHFSLLLRINWFKWKRSVAFNGQFVGMRKGGRCCCCCLLYCFFISCFAMCFFFARMKS